MAHLKKSICVGLLVAIQYGTSCLSAPANDEKTARLIRDARLQTTLTPLETINDFIVHSAPAGSKKPELVAVDNGRIYARLLTPLNSSFNGSGDIVKAVVVGSLTEQGKPWLEEGTILEGRVEEASKATFGQTDGSLVVRFYVAKLGNTRIELSTSSDTDDHTLKPSPIKRVTKKQRVRGVLMIATKLAIPAAIGSGGISIAITTGAGAVIGAAFAEKGNHVKGAVRGAWEGSGLNVLDPIVQKGQSVVLAEGTPLQLLLNEPVYVPKLAPNMVHRNAHSIVSSTITRTRGDFTQMTTHAQLLAPPKKQTNDHFDAASSDDHLASVNRKVAQNDLAGAMIELEQAESLYPDDDQVKLKHAEIYNLISGQQPSNY